MLKKMVLGSCLLALLSAPTFAVVRSQTVTYNATFKGSAVQCKGVMVYDTIPGQRPGILMVHQWMGITDHERQRAEQWVRQGFTVFIADIYGGMVPKDVTEAAKLSTKFKKNPALTRSRAKAALAVLKNNTDKVDPTNIAAMGYCFGGGVVLELARSGEPLKAFISFHGNLDTPSPNAKEIKGEVLILHGADDPYVTWTQVSAFKKEMQTAKATWSMGVFGNALHGFTQRSTGVDVKGVGYNLTADQDSWMMARQVIRRVMGK